jgi:hypothetical protein
LAGKHHILRLDEFNDFDVVLNRQKYFTAMTTVNGWRQGTTVVFLKNTDDGDGVIGIGNLECVVKYTDMCTEDKKICEETRNSFLVKFSKLESLSYPKLVKETAIGNWGIYGKMLHGKSVSDRELATILR